MTPTTKTHCAAALLGSLAALCVVTLLRDSLSLAADDPLALAAALATWLAATAGGLALGGLVGERGRRPALGALLLVVSFAPIASLMFQRAAASLFSGVAGDWVTAPRLAALAFSHALTAAPLGAVLAVLARGPRTDPRQVAVATTLGGAVGGLVATGLVTTWQPFAVAWLLIPLGGGALALAEPRSALVALLVAMSAPLTIASGLPRRLETQSLAAQYAPQVVARSEYQPGGHRVVVGRPGRQTAYLNGRRLESDEQAASSPGETTRPRPVAPPRSAGPSHPWPWAAAALTLILGLAVTGAGHGQYRTRRWAALAIVQLVACASAAIVLADWLWTQGVLGTLYHRLGALLACAVAGVAGGLQAARAARPRRLSDLVVIGAMFAALLPRLARVLPGMPGDQQLATVVLIALAAGLLVGLALPPVLAMGVAPATLGALAVGGAALGSLVAAAHVIPAAGPDTLCQLASAALVVAAALGLIAGGIRLKVVQR